MLKQLYIKNFVLIDELEVNFHSGMSVITGETGAGKSILFGAMSLLKGKRADLSELKDKSEKSIIEARIDVSKYKLRREFEAAELDYLDEAIFRRELSPQGKSRAFINDTPVRLEQMQELGDLLFDIHSQHQSIQLNDPSYRLEIIDQLAGTNTVLNEYQDLYQSYKLKQKELAELKELSRNAIQEQDYLQFQFEEVEKLNLKAGEEDELEGEHRLLANGEQLVSLSDHIHSLLDAEEPSTLANLNTALHKLEELSRLNPSMKELLDRFRTSYLELRDISSEIEDFKESFEFDPQRLNFIEERMSEIHRLKHKHGLETADELIGFQSTLEEKLQSISDYDERIAKLESALYTDLKVLQAKATELSEKRKSHYDLLKASVESSLKNLGIPNAQFSVQNEMTELSETGIDRIDFLFSANQGKELQSVRKVASGGELSRIMLALKRELARKKQMPALMFDEIDTGVSGEVADQLGRILREMGETHQILSITHLPQLAAKGKFHYFVYKQNELGLTKTFIKQLTEDERVEELAKMLSGEKVSDAAINNAKELLAR